MRRKVARLGIGSVFLATAGLLCVTGSSGCGGSEDSHAAPGAGGEAGEEAHGDTPKAAESEAIAVEVAAAVRRPLSSLYATSGVLRADRIATVTARTHGVVRRLLVEEGARVTEGQTLLLLEDEEQKIQDQRARATLAIEAREQERARALHAQGLLSEADYETTRREAEEARHGAELASLSLSRTVIRAPFPGRVLRRHIDAGTTVSDGTPVYDLADLDPLHADVNVPERHVARLAAGQSVRLEVDTSPEPVPATIERIAPAVDPASGTVKVTLAVPGTPHLRPGAFVRVGIVTDTHPEALVVPRSALVAEGRRWYLFRLEPGGKKVEKLEVGTGFEEGELVEVVATAGSSAAVRAGDRVVVVGASALTDGAAVEVLEARVPA